MCKSDEEKHFADSYSSSLALNYYSEHGALPNFALCVLCCVANKRMKREKNKQTNKQTKRTLLFDSLNYLYIRVKL